MSEPQKPKMAELEQGWFVKQLAGLPAEIAYSADPQTAWSYGATNITAPLDKDNARRLRSLMAKRYRLWTGRHLWADLKADATWT